MTEQFFVGMMGIAEGADFVVAECVDVEGTLREDPDLWRVFVEVDGHRDGYQLRHFNYLSLWLRFNFDVGGCLRLWVDDRCPQYGVPRFGGSVRVYEAIRVPRFAEWSEWKAWGSLCRVLYARGMGLCRRRGCLCVAGLSCRD